MPGKKKEFGGLCFYIDFESDARCSVVFHDPCANTVKFAIKPASWSMTIHPTDLYVYSTCYIPLSQNDRTEDRICLLKFV